MIASRRPPLPASARPRLPLVLLVLALFALLPVACRLVTPAPGDRAQPVDSLLVLPDPEGALTLADVAADPAASRFRPLNAEDRREPGAAGRVTWLRLVLPNPAPQPARVVLGFDNVYLDEVVAYPPRPDDSAPPRTGQRIPFAQRSLPSTLPALAFTLPAQAENVVYLRCAASFGPVPRVHLWASPESFWRAEKLQFFSHTVYFGVWGALFFYNAFVFAVLRDRVVGRYLGYLASVGLLAFLGSNLYELFLPPLSGVVREWVVFSLLALSSLALVRFGRAFLDDRSRPLRWLERLAAAGLCATPLLLWEKTNAALVGGIFLLALLAFVALPLAGVVLWRRGNRRAPLFALAVACYACGLGWAILAQLGALPPDPTNGFPAIAGATLEIVFLGIAVAHRYALIRDDHAKLQSTYAAQLEADVAARTRELSELSATLARSNDDKDRLIAIIAHDVRTPLVSLLALSRTLAGDAAGTVRRQCSGLLDLVNNLLDWARLRTGQLPHRPHPINLAGVSASALRATLAAAEAKGVRLTLALPDDLDALADGRALECLLRNLAGNAVKFTPAGGAVTLDATRDGAWIDLRVADTGAGIPPDRLAALNAAGVSVASTPGTAGEPGAGFGLALCRELAAREGGALTLSAAPGGGTVATLRLPATTAHADWN